MTGGKGGKALILVEMGYNINRCIWRMRHVGNSRPSGASHWSLTYMEQLPHTVVTPTCLVVYKPIVMLTDPSVLQSLTEGTHCC